MASRSAMERFSGHVIVRGDCHLWTGAHVAKGYGIFSLGKKKVYAHRWIYEQAGNVISMGFEVDHLCRVPACVKLAHLEAVTPEENRRRSNSVSTLNAAKTRCAQGHAFNEANTHVDKVGQRHCRECGRIRAHARYQRNPSLAAAIRKAHRIRSKQLVA